MKKNIVKKTKKTAKNNKSSVKKEKQSINSGTILECQECGMVVVVDELCGCEEYHPVICCGEEMIIK